MRPHGGGIVRRGAAQQMGVHADGAVMATHLMEDRRRGLADGGEAAAAIQLLLGGEQLGAPPLALEAGVAEPLQDGVERERRQAGGGESHRPAGACGQQEEAHHDDVQKDRRARHVRAERLGDPRPRAGRREPPGTRCHLPPRQHRALRDDDRGHEVQRRQRADADRRDPHGVLEHVERMADVAVGDGVGVERLAAPASRRLGGDPFRRHQACAVEHDDECEAEERRHPEDGQDGGAEGVRRRRARPHHRHVHVDVGVERQPDAERPLEREERDDQQIARPLVELEPRQARESQREMQPAQPEGARVS